MNERSIPVSFSVDEAARLLRLHPETIRRHLRRGTIEGVQLGKRGSYRIPESELSKLPFRLQDQMAVSEVERAFLLDQFREAVMLINDETIPQNAKAAFVDAVSALARSVAAMRPEGFGGSEVQTRTEPTSGSDAQTSDSNTTV